MEKTFIYGLADPRSNAIRYVGKADNPSKRYRQHLSCRSNPSKRQWIKELKAEALTPVLVVLAEIPMEEWAEQERYWIKKVQDEGFSLLNIRDGGCNKGNYKNGRASLRLKNPKHVQDKLIAKMKRLSLDDMTVLVKLSKETLNKALAGKPVKPETIRKIADALRLKIGEIATFMSN